MALIILVGFKVASADVVANNQVSLPSEDSCKGSSIPLSCLYAPPITFKIHVGGEYGGEIWINNEGPAVDGSFAPGIPDGTCGIRFTDLGAHGGFPHVYWYWAQGEVGIGPKIDTLPFQDDDGYQFVGDDFPDPPYLEFWGPYPGCDAGQYSFSYPFLTPDKPSYEAAGATVLVVLVFEFSHIEFIDSGGELPEFPELPDPAEPPDECEVPEFCEVDPCDFTLELVAVISSDCLVEKDATASSDVEVRDGSVLVIPNGVTLDIDFVNHSLTVESGSGVKILNGGKLH